MHITERHRNLGRLRAFPDRRTVAKGQVSSYSVRSAMSLLFCEDSPVPIILATCHCSRAVPGANDGRMCPCLGFGRPSLDHRTETRRTCERRARSVGKGSRCPSFSVVIQVTGEHSKSYREFLGGSGKGKESKMRGRL